MVKCTRKGLVVKRPGVLSKVQMLNLVLGVGVFSLLPKKTVPTVPVSGSGFWFLSHPETNADLPFLGLSVNKHDTSDDLPD